MRCAFRCVTAMRALIAFIPRLLNLYVDTTEKRKNKKDSRRVFLHNLRALF
jgi:hypothetical protein